MTFGKLTLEGFIAQLTALKIEGFPMWGTVFYQIFPKSPKFALKEKFKPNQSKQGIYTNYLADVRQDDDFKSKIRNALWPTDACQMGRYYSDAASLKLHVSLNNISDVDEAVIIELIQLLNKQSESTKTNVNFFYKIIKPEASTGDRFSNNDQITIYFDKYSSLAEVITLSETISAFLSKKGVANHQPLGPKDVFGLNQHVSARFDNNKLLAEYGIYPFFDLELKKLLESPDINKSQLKQVPLCGLEAVFHHVLSLGITVPELHKLKLPLSEADSAIVQRELREMLNAPVAYIKRNPIDEVDAPEKRNTPTVNVQRKPPIKAIEPPLAEIDMSLLSVAMKVLGGLTVAIGIAALCYASLGSALFIAGGISIAVGLASFTGGFFVNHQAEADIIVFEPLAKTVI